MKSIINKKGFTLAELLIVVSILTILAIIALPIFIGSLKKAELTVENAGVRAVKGAAVTKLFSNPQEYDIRGMEDADGWFVDAEVAEDGSVSKIEITPSLYDDEHIGFKQLYIEWMGTAEGARVVSDYAVIYKFESAETNETVMGVYLFLRPIDLGKIPISG